MFRREVARMLVTAQMSDSTQNARAPEINTAARKRAKLKLGTQMDLGFGRSRSTLSGKTS